MDNLNLLAQSEKSDQFKDIWEIFLNECKANKDIVCKIIYSYPDETKKEYSYVVQNLNADELFRLFEDAFGNVDFAADKYWISISCGEVCYILPCGYLDIQDYGPQYIITKNRDLVRRWIKNNFVIPEYADVVTSATYKYIVNHKRVFK